jgi:hypothetical protein
MIYTGLNDHTSHLTSSLRSMFDLWLADIAPEDRVIIINVIGITSASRTHFFLLSKDCLRVPLLSPYGIEPLASKMICNETEH